MKSILFIASVGLIFLITSCTIFQQANHSINLKEYYYPVEDLNEPRVYHFKTGEELNEHIFWKLSKELDNGVTYLISDVYSYDENGNLIKIEETKEKITENGAFVVEHVEYEQDDFGNTFKLNSVINDNCLFLWEMKPDEEIKWSYSNQSKVFKNRTTYVTKESQLERTEGENVFKGNNYQSVIFKDFFNYEYANSETEEIESSVRVQQTSYYAKGLGLISYSLKLPNGIEMSFSLEEIISNKEWNRRFDN